ncbi:DUF7344 domain-containing protein [Halorussus aquaticus]|uniref:DUF7344 domain-containing protein n=1 Tax=Halorussus aquaticus TaxID=2953748 RepID=A0ABD5Q7H5_9EURY|nr:hypothetical protein [Halorussus aquaticus]
MSDDAWVGNSGEENRGVNIGRVDDCTLNEALDLLRDQQRRYVLKKLRATDEGVAVIDELVEYLLTHDPDADDRDQVALMIHHKTLPRLADAGVIDFDARSDTVRYHGSEVVDDLLAVVVE